MYSRSNHDTDRSRNMCYSDVDIVQWSWPIHRDKCDDDVGEVKHTIRDAMIIECSLIRWCSIKQHVENACDSEARSCFSRNYSKNIRDSLMRSPILYKLILLIWLVMNVNMVVCDVDHIYALPDNHRWANAGADVAVAMDASVTKRDEIIDFDHLATVKMYDDEFNTVETDDDDDATQNNRILDTITVASSVAVTKSEEPVAMLAATTTAVDDTLDPADITNSDSHYSSTWAVHVPSGDEEAQLVAAEHGFTVLGKVCCIKSIFYF